MSADDQHPENAGVGSDAGGERFTMGARSVR
jgi:hypothetical protein